MSKIVTLTKAFMKFPPDCLVCGATAREEVSIEKLFLYSTGGRGNFNLSADVEITIPVCEVHYQDLIEESPVEHFLMSKSNLLAILSGLLGAFFVLWRVQSISNEAIFFGIFLAILIGIGLYNLIVVLDPILASVFASPESKEIRKSIHLVSYSVKSDLLQIEFENEHIADMVVKENLQTAL